MTILIEKGLDEPHLLSLDDVSHTAKRDIGKAWNLQELIPIEIISENGLK